MLYKIADISGWILLALLVLYFISGYAMVHKYGMQYLMNNAHAWSWHRYLTIPFFIFLVLHIVPYYVVRKQLKKMFVISSIVVLLPVLGVYGINTLQVKEQHMVTTQQKEVTDNAVRCQNCPRNCIIKPNETGQCGQFKNIDGKLKPIEETK